jgi:hypothetical protein
MTYGVTKLRKNQYGKESTPGSVHAATALWVGEVNGIKDESPYVLPPMNVGYLMHTDIGYFSGKAAGLDVPDAPASFEQIMYPLEGGIAIATPSSNGSATTAYIRSYPLLSTAMGYVLTGSSVNPVQTFSIEAGDNSQAYVMEFSFCESFTLKGAIGQAVMLGSKWVGRQKTAATFTGAIGVPTIEQVVFNNAKLYVDDTGGTIGATQKVGTFLGFELTVKTGWIAQQTGDGALFFNFIKCPGAEITGKITYEYDTAGIAAETKFAAGTTQLLRIAMLGSSLGAGGTYATKILQFSTAAKITSVDPIGSQNGDDTVTANFTCVQGNAGQTTPTFVSCNTLATVP